MSKKLSKHGNSLALVIEKPILKILKIDQNTDLEINIENGALIIKPLKNNQNKKTLHDTANEIMDKYNDVFKKLAK